jgi:hypothetical protein
MVLQASWHHLLFPFLYYHFSPCSLELISRISSHPAVFFSHNEPANSTFSHNKPAKRTGRLFLTLNSPFVISGTGSTRVYICPWVGYGACRSSDVTCPDSRYSERLSVCSIWCQQAHWDKSVVWSISEPAGTIEDTASMFSVFALFVNSLWFTSLTSLPNCALCT